MSVVHTKQKLDATSLAIESEFDFCLPEFRWPTGTVEPDEQKRIPLRYEFYTIKYDLNKYNNLLEEFVKCSAN